jgi:membrane-bound ClpP family serine protease
MWRFLINSSGHASEIITGAVCIYLGLSTARFNRHRREKIILFTLGSNLLVNAAHFAISLSDAGFVSDYVESEKVHDFVKISNAMGLPYSFFSAALLVFIALGIAIDCWLLARENIKWGNVD